MLEDTSVHSVTNLVQEQCLVFEDGPLSGSPSFLYKPEICYDFQVPVFLKKVKNSKTAEAQSDCGICLDFYDVPHNPLKLSCLYLICPQFLFILDKSFQDTGAASEKHLSFSHSCIVCLYNI